MPASCERSLRMSEFHFEDPELKNSMVEIGFLKCAIEKDDFIHSQGWQLRTENNESFQAEVRKKRAHLPLPLHSPSWLLKEGGDRVVVPWYQKGSTWYNIVQMWWKLVPKVGVPVPSLYKSAPIKISSLDDFGIPRTNF